MIYSCACSQSKRSRSPTESGSDEKLGNMLLVIKVSPGQCFQTLPNILDAALFAVLVAFLPFFLPQGQDNTPMETMRTGFLVDIKVNTCSV